MKSSIEHMQQELRSYTKVREKKPRGSWGGKRPGSGWKKGVPHTPKMQFSSKLAFINFQLRAARGNIGAQWIRVGALEHEVLESFTPQVRRAYEKLGRDMQKLLDTITELDTRVARFNRLKKTGKV